MSADLLAALGLAIERARADYIPPGRCSDAESADTCGKRCESCEDRICNTTGPSLGGRCSLHVLCDVCASDGTDCLECADDIARRAADLEDDREYVRARDERGGV